LRPLWNEVVHDGQEAGGQEEAHRVVTIPPLRQRVLNPSEELVALGTEQRDRHCQVVDDVQHRDGDDEGQIEPVGHIDMRLFALPDRAEEDEKVATQTMRQPEVCIPFRLGVFLAIG
jgi:23S rRNA (cytosine1962-C5)-methyltransferase